MSTSTLITADQFADMSFDVPVELIRGEIVEMTNPGGVHGRVCARIAYLLEAWSERTSDFMTFGNDCGVLLEQAPDTVRGPDVFVVRRDRLPEGRIPLKHFTVPPEVAIEVKSPSDRWREILQKVLLFLDAGIGEVWVVDPEQFHVHIYRSDDEPTIFNCEDNLTSSFLPGFVCSVNELFRDLK